MSPPPEELIDDAEALRRLGEIEHIVVLMMENRSFDQMLGFLEADGLDVDGLGSAKPNFDAEGNEYKPFEWGVGETAPDPPLGMRAKVLDPDHSPDGVREQLANGNTGFVKNFAKTRKHEGERIELSEEFLRVPMGHFGPGHLPVYRHLAHNFCVCDAWHCSIPGDTWPNRLYALAGTDAPKLGYKPSLFKRMKRFFKRLPGLKILADAPIFDVTAFTHHLRDEQWRWYSHDPATLRAADGHYRRIADLKRDNFTYFNRKRVHLRTEAAETVIAKRDSFLDDAAKKGELRDVSWIDPNFVDLSIFDPNSNDDHPPSDVRAGQSLVLELYEALARSPNWENTLLVIVYDENGGFYDHVAPPAVDVGSDYPTLGPRVPALVVGPRVRKHVSHQTFEHTSLIATILRRFADDPEAALRAMPKRVREAPHLGALLAAEPRTDIEDREELRVQMAEWRKTARKERRAGNSPSEAPDGAGHELELHDFQEAFVKFVLAMREEGMPGSQP